MKSSKLAATSQIKATNNTNSSSSSSSWSSSCSSSSSSSSSPPKTRSANANTNPIELTGLNEQSNYKKPCLISPRKAGANPASLNPINENKPAPNEEQYPNTDSSTTLSSSSSCSSSNLLGNKSLTIVVRNSSLDEQGAEAKTAKAKPNSSPAAKSKQDGLDSSDSTVKQSASIEIIDLSKANRIAQRVNKSSIVSSSSAATAGISGYLWKSKESIDAAPSLSHQFEKCWFSLNANLCCLVYWHDKYEQDLGKLPLGKYELIKCTQVVKDHLQPQFYHNHYSNMQSLNESLDFKLCFHQNTTFIVLRAMSPDNKASWCDTLRHTIENNSGVCSKCKPKLVVNPMPLMAFTNSLVIGEDAQKRNNVKQSALGNYKKFI